MVIKLQNELIIKIVTKDPLSVHSFLYAAIVMVNRECTTLGKSSSERMVMREIIKAIDPGGNLLARAERKECHLTVKHSIKKD